MATLQVKYAIPVTAVRIQGAVHKTFDSVLDTPDESPEVTVSLETVAGDRNQTLQLPAGKIWDASATLGLTEDGRLNAFAVETTGQAGRVVLGVAGVAAALASGVVGAAPAVLATALPPTFPGINQQDAPALTPEQKVAKKYRGEHEAEATQRDHYAKLITDAVTEIAALTAEISTAEEDERWKGLRRLRFLQDLLPVLRAELALLNDHYKAWRASTLKTESVAIDTRFTFDTLRKAEISLTDGVPSIKDGEVKTAWERFGVLVTVHPAPAGAFEAVPEHNDKRRVWVRVPRSATVSFYEKGDDGKAVLVREVEQLLMDSYCELEAVPLRRSIWGKRQLGLTFGDSGGLTGVSTSETSSAAAAAEAAGGVPAAVAGGLENAVKIRDQIAKLQDASADQQLARAKKEVELKQQEITQAGLLATEKDAAELERLKQQADMIEKNKIVNPAKSDPSEIDKLKEQLDLLDARREVSIATRRLEAESELSALRLEIERVRAEWQRNNPGGKPR